MSIASLLKIIYERINKYLAIICFLIGIIGILIQNLEIQVGALLTLVFVLITILFEIHTNLTEKNPYEPKKYDNYNIVAPFMDELIDQEISKNKKVHITWLGTCMDYGWPYLRNYLAKLDSLSKPIEIQVDIIMLSSDWSDIGKVNRIWKEETSGMNSSIKAYKNNKLDKENIKIDVDVYTYESMPHYTGLLINNNYLFLALCKWNGDQYAVGSNEYTLYTKDYGYEHKKIFDEFNKWIKFYKTEDI